MASTLLTALLPLCFLLLTLTFISLTAAADANLSWQIAAADDLEWPAAMSLFDGKMEGESDDGGEDDYAAGRRSLFWRRMRYYISYGAMSANRIPCPPRSGRSYYTHNCYKVRGPAHPYTRGCSAITRCAR